MEYIGIVYDYLSAIGSKNSSKYLEQSGFARTARTHNAEDFSLVGRKIKALENPLGPKGLSNIFALNNPYSSFSLSSYAFRSFSCTSAGTC